MIMQGYIILRDIPKELVQLDMMQFEIQGGFRGFSHVEPGFHFVSIKKDDEIHEGFWCFVEADKAVIKQFNYSTNNFENCSIDEEEHYSQLATSGAMGRVLIPIMPWNFKAVAKWNILTNYLKKERAPFSLNFEEPMLLPEKLSPDEAQDWFTNDFKSRFEQAFELTHTSEIDSFLAEFQYAFVRYIVRQNDTIAFERWIHILQACYNAGERVINSQPKLFDELVTILTFQFDLLDQSFFTKNSKLLSGTQNFVEDMIDTENKTLIEQAERFTNYFRNRGINL